MRKEANPIIRSFTRIYPQREKLSLTQALNIIMEEISRGEITITKAMEEIAQAAIAGEKGKK